MLHPGLRRLFAAAAKRRVLYTWGSQKSGLGYPEGEAKNGGLSPHPLPFNGNITSVALAGATNFFLDSQGKTWVFGDNPRQQERGKVVQMENAPKAVKMTAGMNHVLILGVLPDPYQEPYPMSHFVGKIRLRRRTEQESVTDQLFTAPFIPVPNKTGSAKVLDIASGREFCLILRGNSHPEDGVPFRWGHGGNGELLGTKVEGYFYPISAAESLVETAESGEGKLTSLFAGWYNACSLLGKQHIDNGDALCWGHNNQGQLGVGVDETANMFDSHVIAKQFLIEDEHVQKMAMGNNVSVALTAKGNVYLAGNSVWWIPMKLELPAGDPAVDVFAGQNFGGCIGQSGKVYVYGRMLGKNEETSPRGLKVSIVKDEVFDHGKVLSIVTSPQVSAAIVEL